MNNPWSDPVFSMVFAALIFWVLKKKALPIINLIFIKFYKHIKTKKNIQKESDSKFLSIINITPSTINCSLTTGNATTNFNTTSIVLTFSKGEVISFDDGSLISTTISSEKNVPSSITINLKSTGLSETDKGNYDVTSVITSNSNFATCIITCSITNTGSKTDSSKTSATILINYDNIAQAGQESYFSDFEKNIPNPNPTPNIHTTNAVLNTGEKSAANFFKHIANHALQIIIGLIILYLGYRFGWT